MSRGRNLVLALLARINDLAVAHLSSYLSLLAIRAEGTATITEREAVVERIISVGQMTSSLPI